MPLPRAGLLVLHCCREWMMSSYLLIVLRLLHVLLSLPQLRGQNHGPCRGPTAKSKQPSQTPPAIHRSAGSPQVRYVLGLPSRDLAQNRLVTPCRVGSESSVWT